MNKNSKTILVAALVLVFFGLGIYFITKNKSPVVNEDNTVSASISGCYVAKLGQDIYTLDIESENGGNVSGMLAYNNYQKDSSSGSFQGIFTEGKLLGDYSFDSEGMHSDRQVIFKQEGDNFIQGFGPTITKDGKESFANLNEITYDPKSTFVKNSACTEHFTDKDNTFSFDYNSFFSASVGDKSVNMDWRMDAAEAGVRLAQVFVPRGYMSGTNFSDAELIVGRSTDPIAIKKCSSNIRNDEKRVGEANIGGHSFSKFTFTGAAAGNFYETTSYRGIVDGDCYAIEYTIHSTNLGNYSPEQGIKEFDKSKITNDMENIVKSFKFLINSD